MECFGDPHKAQQKKSFDMTDDERKEIMDHLHEFEQMKSRLRVRRINFADFQRTHHAEEKRLYHAHA